MKPAYMLAFILIIVSLGVTLYTFSFAIAQHVTISQVEKMPGQSVQVPGKILKDTVNYDAAHTELRFDIEEMKTKQPKRMTVVYKEPKPENFDSATSVEAVGMYKNGVFYARNLLVKCPSKYNDEAKKESSSAGSAFTIASGIMLLGATAVGIPLIAIKRRGASWK